MNQVVVDSGILQGIPEGRLASAGASRLVPQTWHKSPIVGLLSEPDSLQCVALLCLALPCLASPRLASPCLAFFTLPGLSLPALPLNCPVLPLHFLVLPCPASPCSALPTAHCLLHPDRGADWPPARMPDRAVQSTATGRAHPRPLSELLITDGQSCAAARHLEATHLVSTQSCCKHEVFLYCPVEAIPCRNNPLQKQALVWCVLCICMLALVSAQMVCSI